MTRKKKFQPRPWFRHYACARHDAKLKLLAFEDQRHFWCINEMKCEGELDKEEEQSPELRERMISVGLGLDLRCTAEVKRRLREVGLIGDDWQPLAWPKRQFEGDYSNDRVKRHRSRKKSNADVTLQGCYGNAPDSDSEADTEKDPDRKRAREPVRPEGAARALRTETRQPDRQQASGALKHILDRAARSP